MSPNWRLRRDAKSLIGCIASLVLLAGVVSTAAAQLPPPVLQYTLDPGHDDPTISKGIKDQSGNGFDGTVLDPDFVMFVPGPSGNLNAMHFMKNDGIPGSGITTDPDTSTLGINTGPFTLMAWVNLDNRRGDNMVFGTGADPALRLGFRNGDYYFGFGRNDDIQVPGIPVGEWHHVAWRFTGASTPGDQDILMDGIPIICDPGHDPYNQNQLLLIARTVPNAGAFGGSLSDVRVYNVALSDADIAFIAATPP